MKKLLNILNGYETIYLLPDFLRNRRCACISKSIQNMHIISPEEGTTRETSTAQWRQPVMIANENNDPSQDDDDADGDDGDGGDGGDDDVDDDDDDDG